MKIINVIIERAVACMTRALPNDRSLAQPDFNFEASDDITTGHCYVMAEVLHHILRERGIHTRAYYVRLDRFFDGKRTIHWFLRPQDGSVIDPSAAQFAKYSWEVPYDEGKPSSFRLPRGRLSGRGTELLRRMKQLSGGD